jgi:hypothetical protein
VYVIPSLGEDARLRAINLSDGSSTPVEELRGAEFPVLSPNGRWIAYARQEPGSSRYEVFVQPWPALDRKWPVSVNGGSAPAWTRNGAELVFTVLQPVDSAGETATRMMSIEVGAGGGGGPDFSWQPARELFTAVIATSNPLRAYDVTKDGSRFLVAIGPRVSAPPGEPRMIVNWFTQLRRLSAQRGSR